MDKDAYLEINASQRPALALFEAMGYTYISPADCDKQRGSRYRVLLRDILRGQLRRLNRYVYAGAENEFSAANIERAMEDLDEPLTDGLVRTSEKIYDALLLGKSYPETVGDGKMLSFNLKYIDWDNPQNNVFHVTEEFAVDSRDRQHNARPDIVLFINGIPFAVKKRGGVSDANHIAACGPICVDGLGPTGDFDHSPREYLELSTIQPNLRFAWLLLQDLADQKEDI